MTVTKLVPAQESRELWLSSFLLRREVELQELYDMPTRELDIIRTETAILKADTGTRRPKALIAGYFNELAGIITERREREGV